MSNRHVKELLNLWTGILADACHAFPTLRDEFERDLARLQRAVVHRGIRVLLEDLPAIGKHFDRCLSCGLYKLSQLPLAGRYANTVQIPKFLRGLYLEVFHSSGQLKEDCNVEAVFFVRQLTLAFKKGKLRCSAEADEKEVVEFFAVDSGLPEPEKFWESERSRTDDHPSGTQEVSSETRCVRDGCGHGCEVNSSTTGRLPHRVDVESECSVIPSTVREGTVHANVQGLRRRATRLALGTDDELHGRSSTPELGSPVDESKDSSPKLPGQTVGARRITYEGFSTSPLYQGRVNRTLSPQKRERLSFLLARLDFVSNLVTTTLGPYSPSEWRFRHGPGAVSEYRGPTNKYCWTNWSDNLESEYPIADYGFHNLSSWADRIHSGPDISSEELCSRLLCVPKTYSKPRIIAAEPSANQWCQQNIRHYFDERAASSWINDFVRFHDQSLNQSLCVVGSRDGTLATIDLSAASDRVTCHAVGQMFRANPKLLNCLAASRTQSVSQSVTQKVPGVIRLRKFSTMGNACTFPVESLIFLSAALAATLVSRGIRSNRESYREITSNLAGQVAVYGDDIIVPVDSRELLIEALEILDFKVNANKSYWSGNFRESCGVDAFQGTRVTPAYWRTFNDGKPESLASTVASRNNFHRLFLLHAASRLASTIRKDIPTVSMGSGVFGLKSFAGPDLRGFKLRGNEDLQRTEVLVASLIGKQTRTPIENDSALLQFFTEDPDPFTKWESGVPQRPEKKIRLRWVALSDLAARCSEAK